MELSIQGEDGDLIQVALSGRITQDQIAINADPLLDVVGAKAYASKVLLDMRDADFMDSSGLSWLLTSHKHFKDGEGRLILHSVPPVVLNVLKVLRMHMVFEIADNEDEARKKLQGDRP